MHERVLLLAALVLSAGCLTAADGGAPTVHQAEARSEAPYDPQAPGTAGDVALAVGLGATEVVVAGPLRIHSHEGVVDQVDLVAPTGTTLASIACGVGSCELAARDQRTALPAATLVLDGAWRAGRPTGARLVAPDGSTAVHLALFGDERARLTGEGLAAPITLTSTLLVAGDPRDVDRVAAFAPDGSAVLDVRPGGAGLASATLAGHRADAEQVRARLQGDPLADEEVALTVWLDGSRRKFTLAGLATPPGEVLGPAAPIVRLNSPTGQSARALTLVAGPATLEGSGVLSPQFDVHVRLVVPAGEGTERAWLHLDTGASRALAPVGQDAAGDLVLLGEVPAWLLVGEHRSRITVRTVLERDLAPGLVQETALGPIVLTLDTHGPPPPVPVVQGTELSWSPVEDAARYEGEARWEDGAYRPLAVDGHRASAPAGPAGTWHGRVRAVDAAGNAGPWSDEVVWSVVPAPGLSASPPPDLELLAPREGATLQGVTEVRWRDEPSVTLVRIEHSIDAGATWTAGASGHAPPLAWDTRVLPDGPVLLRVIAEGPGGTTSRLLSELTVDNLAPLPITAAGTSADPWAAGAPVPPPQSTSPLPVAVLALLVALGGVMGVAWWRTGGRARDK